MRHYSFLLVLPLVAACASAQDGYATAETAVASVLISPQQENQLGLQFKTELEKDEKVRYLTDPLVNNYVRDVSNKVMALGRQARPEMQWQVFVIDDPKTVNAFATPGGYLYVYTGLIQMADNEAELVGVMAHETGHVVGRHSARALVSAYGLQAISALALGQNPNLLAQLTANVATAGTMLAHSRGQETEADEYGARYTAQAGYDPHALGTFFQKLMAKEGNTPAILALLSDHPATADRIAHVNDYITQQKLRGTELGASRLQTIKTRLAVLPPSSSRPGAPPGGAPPGGAPPGGAPPGGAPPNNVAGKPGVPPGGNTPPPPPSQQPAPKKKGAPPPN